MPQAKQDDDEIYRVLLSDLEADEEMDEMDEKDDGFGAGEHPRGNYAETMTDEDEEIFERLNEAEVRKAEKALINKLKNTKFC